MKPTLPFLFGLTFVLGSVNLAKAEPIQVQIDQAIPHESEKVGVGSIITLKIPGQTGSHAGVFLGKMQNPDGSSAQDMVLDTDQKRVYMADEKDITFSETSLQPILRQYDQVGGTCTGYAIDHFLQEMIIAGADGNGTLKTALETEKGRTQLLVDTINQYYLVTQHRFSLNGILDMYGKQYGYHCEKKMFQDSTSAINYVEASLKTGLPVFVSFYIGPDMTNSPYSIKDYSNNTPLLDRRLWTPRKTGDRNSGGHSVVAIAAFEANQKRKLLMLDSDWSEPRIWDIDDYLGNTTAIAEMEFYNCK